MAPFKLNNNEVLKIMLDPGHGAGKAYNRGYVGPVWKNEGDGNWYFSRILTDELLKYKRIQVDTTRPKITDTPGDATGNLRLRGQKAKGYHIFISLHTNAFNGTANGVEIYADVNDYDRDLMRRLIQAISTSLDVKVRGTDGVMFRYSNGGNYYGVLAGNLAKIGMLIEHCFHDNFNEITKYENRARLLASKMASAIANYYGLDAKENAEVVPEISGEKESGGFVNLFGGKAPMIISKVEKLDQFENDDYYKKAIKLIRDKFYPSYNPIEVTSGTMDYAGLYGKVNYNIGLGGHISAHSSTINYHIPGNTGEEVYRNVLKFRAGGLDYLKDNFSVAKGE